MGLSFDDIGRNRAVDRYVGLLGVGWSGDLVVEYTFTDLVCEEDGHDEEKVFEDCGSTSEVIAGR